MNPIKGQEAVSMRVLTASLGMVEVWCVVGWWPFLKGPEGCFLSLNVPTGTAGERMHGSCRLRWDSSNQLGRQATSCYSETAYRRRRISGEEAGCARPAHPLHILQPAMRGNCKFLSRSRAVNRRSLIVQLPYSSSTTRKLIWLSRLINGTNFVTGAGASSARLESANLM